MPLSGLIRLGFEEALRGEPALPGRRDEPLLAALPARDLPRLLHSRAVPLERQNQTLAAVVRCYRRAPGSGWAPVMLEMLSPMLVGAAGRFLFVPVDVSIEDLNQQVIAEALHAARFMRLPEDGRDLQLRLRRRLLKRTARWLIGNLRSQGESLEEAVDQGAGYRDLDQRFLMELGDSGVSPENLALLYRTQVLGMTAREVAVEMNISVSAVVSRQHRAVVRLRRWAPTRFRQFCDGIRTAA
jgi:DNA-directed RNA polymerase specialized sigma24 family protein